MIRPGYDERQEQEQPTLDEEFIGNFLLMRAELTDAQRSEVCARWTTTASQ